MWLRRLVKAFPAARPRASKGVALGLLLCLLVILAKKRLLHAYHVVEIHKLIIEKRLPLVDGRAVRRRLVQRIIEPRREEFDHELVVVTAIPWRLRAWARKV